MRFGVIASVLATLVFVATVAVPAPGSVPELPQGPAPAAGAFPLCLVLELERPTRHTVLVRLTDSLRGRSSSLTWFAATRVSASGWAEPAAWRPAGGDSIDLSWYHSPLIRLPAAGQARIGLAYPRTEGSPLLMALFSQPTPAQARETACPSARAPAA